MAYGELDGVSRPRPKEHDATTQSGVGSAATVLVVLAVSTVTAVVTQSRALPAAVPANAGQRAVVAAVETFAVAWREGDCAAYLEITTQLEQEKAGVTDCASFDSRAAAFADVVTDGDS